MRAIFFGTPQLAVPSLEAVCSVAEVVRVICQPDRPAGRGMLLRPPPVKERALELGLEVEQPTKVKTPDFAASLRELDADVAVVIAYGRIADFIRTAEALHEKKTARIADQSAAPANFCSIVRG